MNCKPGDLAFIIRSDFPENIGRIVRVYWLDSPIRWRVVPVDARPMRGYCNGSTAMLLEGAIRDRNLRPIRPEPELLPAPPVAVTA